MGTLTPIVLLEGNTTKLRISVAPDDPTDDLTLVTSMRVLLKPNADTPDTDPGVVTLTTAVPAQMLITVQTTQLIRATAFLPASALVSPYPHVWRVDCLVGTAARTVMYGPATIVNL